MDAVINQQLLCKRGIFSSFPLPVGDSVGCHVSGRDRGATMRWGLSVCAIKRAFSRRLQPPLAPTRPPSQARRHLEGLSWQRAAGLSFLLVHTGACECH